MASAPPVEIVDRHIDTSRQLRVAVIGAGVSGVSAGVLLPAKVPGIKLVIYDKNADVVREVFLFDRQSRAR
jgi:2-polyprenyl-6-methoxyphenol hydroxylase-like FAD-dependent oxidoreductase